MTIARYTLFDTERLRLPPSKRMKANANASLEDLTAMIWQVLKVLRPKLNFTSSYPSYLVDQTITGEKDLLDTTQIPDETITWKVVREVPASTSKERFGEPKEYAPRLREDNLPYPGDALLDTDIATKAVQIYGQWFEMILQFDCWAKTNYECEALARWFRHTMNLSIPAFKNQGVKDMHFWARILDGMLERFPGGALVRSLQYYVRIEELTQVNMPVLSQINLLVETGVDVDRLNL